MSKSFVGMKVTAVVRPGLMAAQADFTVMEHVVSGTDDNGNNVLCLVRHENDDDEYVWALVCGDESEIPREDAAFGSCVPVVVTSTKTVPPMMAAALRELADKIDALADEPAAE